MGFIAFCSLRIRSRFRTIVANVKYSLGVKGIIRYFPLLAPYKHSPHILPLPFILS